MVILHKHHLQFNSILNTNVSDTQSEIQANLGQVHSCFSHNCNLQISPIPALHAECLLYAMHAPHKMAKNWAVRLEVITEIAA